MTECVDIKGKINASKDSQIKKKILRIFSFKKSKTFEQKKFEKLQEKFSHIYISFLLQKTSQTCKSISQLSFIGKDCHKLPPLIPNKYGLKVDTLDLSFNRLTTLQGVERFIHLKELILDNNNLSDNISIPKMDFLQTLSINKNRIINLELFLEKIQVSLPALKYLSLLGNKACPNQLSDFNKDEEDYKRYRYYVINQLPNLKFLDSTQVTDEEKSEAKQRGHLMRVAKPLNINAGEDGYTSSPNEYTPLPKTGREMNDHQGAYGKCKYRYSGKHSEGCQRKRDKQFCNRISTLNLKTALCKPLEMNSQISEFSDDPLMVMGQKVYNEFQWSDSDQSEIDFELPPKSFEENGKLPKADKHCDNRKNKIKYIKVKSGNIVKKIRLNLTEITAYFDKKDRLENYKKFLKMIRQLMDKKGTTGEQLPSLVTPDESELQGMTEEEKEQQRQIWQQELAKIEEEIQTLKHVLQSKQRVSQELKRKLGISVWKELTDDLSQGVRNVKESNVYHHVEEKFSQLGKAVADAPIYQKTESVMKAASESTRSILGGLTGGFTQKIGQLKNSESFRSLEEKVGSAYENVKTKVSSSRSSSLQSFNEALREESANRNTNMKSPTSPVITEGKPLS